MLISLEKAVKTYGTGSNEVIALNNVDLSIRENEVCVILGPSGSGKSSLLNILGGLDFLSSGELKVEGKVLDTKGSRNLLNYRRENIGFIFQSYNLIPDLTVEENVEVVSDISKNPLKVSEVLAALEIELLKDRFPGELSGGQQQRVAIARAIVKNPRILLCDELTGALDTKSSKEILKVIEKVNKLYKTTVIIITHNEVIQNMADRIIHIKDGSIISDIENPSKKPAGELEL